jgi:hypothetical protein
MDISTFLKILQTAEDDAELHTVSLTSLQANFTEWKDLNDK